MLCGESAYVVTGSCSLVRSSDGAENWRRITSSGREARPIARYGESAALKLAF
jgi:hypothetical protein